MTAQETPAAETLAATDRRREITAPRVVRLAGCAAAWFVAATLVLELHGLAPGRAQPQLFMLTSVGTIECLHRMGLSALRSWCTSVGYPLGAPMLSGAPELYLGWLFSFLPGVDAWRAHQLSNGLVDVVALVAGFHLMRRWGAPFWVALTTATVYLTSISLLYLNGFAYTFTGFVLLPAYLFAGLVLLRLYETRRWLPAVAGSVALAFLMLFTDGYAYVSASVVFAVFGLQWAIRSSIPWATRLKGVAIWCGANAVAVAAYGAYVPGPRKQFPVSMGVFRAFGLDVWTLVVPQPAVWWPSWIGWHVTVPKLWGDGSNIFANYVGFVTIALVAWYLIRGRDDAVGPARALALAGAAALLMSLGPSLKVHDVAAVRANTISDAVTTLPLPPIRWLYRHVPGLDEMRATYRWFIATRFVFIFVAGLAVASLARDRRRVVRAAAVVVAVLAAVETLPNIPEHLDKRSSSAQYVKTVQTALLPDLRRLVHPGDRMLLLPTSNDFLANALIPFSDGASYNVGIDKNHSLARRSWPVEIRIADRAYPTRAAADRICDAFRSGHLDLVLLPYVSFNRGAFLFPPPPETAAAFRRRATILSSDPRFVTDEGTWMRALRPRTGACGR